MMIFLLKKSIFWRWWRNHDNLDLWEEGYTLLKQKATLKISFFWNVILIIHALEKKMIQLEAIISHTSS